MKGETLMKALKLEHKELTLSICKAIETCYKNDKSTQAEITGLYFTIGQNITQQGEKAYIPHLEKVLTEKYAQIKGFSMRNLRRMRDFYLTYENNAQLLSQALMLGWTQNTVILEYIKVPADREFYIGFAIINSLSKSALITAIESNIKDVAPQESESPIVRATVEPVCQSKDIHEELQANAHKTSVADFSRKCDTAMEMEKKSPIARATAEPVCHNKGIHEEVSATNIQSNDWGMMNKFVDIIKNVNLSEISQSLHTSIMCLWRNNCALHKRDLFFMEMRGEKATIPI